MINRERTKGQTTQWSTEKGPKDRQHDSQQRKDQRTNNDL